ncbi:MAG: serine hydrolase [Planctomycetota bacterium]|nr:serine hydrolase [Planctomycetota bacterium]
MWRLFALFLVLVATVERPLVGADWSEQQVPRLPATETPLRLWNGHDLTGWQGYIGRYFSVQDGVIVGKNGDQDAPKSSTYLLTEKSYRNFRLIFESRLVKSEMHSGIAFWGQAVTKNEGPYTYQGHLVMYPSAYGLHDLFGRKTVLEDKLGIARRVGKQHDWNQMEILAIGNRIRHVVNGQLVADWSDPLPAECDSGPIGLQLHSNQAAQEVQWRGLILTEDPQDKLVTAASRDLGLQFEGNPAESGLDATRLSEIGNWARKLVDDQQASGVVTLVARRGRVVHWDAVGKADIAGGRDMTRDSVFAIASMTKPMTAAAVMILQDEGKLQLDEPVSMYLPAWKDLKMVGGRKPTHEITLRHCLNHTNGLVGDQENSGSLATAIEHLTKKELAFAPGTQWQYGAGLSVAGRVVEVVSGQKFEQFLLERIFQPLQMNETTFTPSLDLQKRLALLYQPTSDRKGLQPGSHWLLDLTGERPPNPSGGLFSTASDVAKFYQMMLNGGELSGTRVLSAAATRQMTSVQTGNLKDNLPHGAGWGYGFSVVHTSADTYSACSPGSFGHGGAFGTVSWADPRQEMLVILLVSRQNFAEERNLRAEIQELARDAIVQ